MTELRLTRKIKVHLKKPIYDVITRVFHSSGFHNSGFPGLSFTVAEVTNTIKSVMWFNLQYDGLDLPRSKQGSNTRTQQGIRVGVWLGRGQVLFRATLFRANPINQVGSGLKPENCLLYTSPSPRDRTRSRMPSSA